MKTILCTTCKTPLIDGSVFCGHCGLPIEDTSAPTMAASNPYNMIDQHAGIDIAAQTLIGRREMMTPPPPTLTEQDLAIIHNDAEATYDMSDAYYNETRKELAQHPTGPLPQQKAEDEDDNDFLPLVGGAGVVASSFQNQQATHVQGVPHLPTAPSAQGTPQMFANQPDMPAHRFNQHQAQPHNRNMPAQPALAKRASRPAMPVHHARRMNPVALGTVLVAAVAGLMVTGWLITHANNQPSSGSSSTIPPSVTQQAQQFKPKMNTSGNMVPGGSISLHGQDFPPGGHVTFTLDNQPLANAGQSSTALSSYNLPNGQPVLLSGVMLRQPSGLDVPVAGKDTVVKADGTFDVAITLPKTWAAGSTHTIQASVQNSQSTAQVSLGIQMQEPGAATAPVSCISASTKQLSFTGITGKSDPAAQGVTLSNCGDTITWSAKVVPDAGGNWLRADITGGSLASNASKDIAVTASNLSAKLGAGTYTGHITFTAGASAATVDVTLTVANNPCIQANTQSLSFSGVAGKTDPAAQTVTIANCGDSEAWSVAVATGTGANWLSVTPTSGTLNAGESKDISITASNLNANLKDDTYTGRVTFSAGTKTAIVNVTLTVVKPPCIQASSSSLSFNNGVAGKTDPAAQKVTISNCGANGNWSSAVKTDNNASWLNVNNNSGSLNANDSKDITVTASNVSANLPAGTYKGHIVFTVRAGSGTNTATVDVTLIVLKAPCVTTSQSSLSYTGVAGKSDPSSAQKVTFTNCGEDGTWTATSDSASWLSVDTGSGSLSASNTQDINITASNLNTSLKAGTYTGTVTFTLTSSTGASTATVNVTLTVSNPPCIQFSQVNGQTASDPSTASLSFSSVATQSDPSAQTVTINNCGDASSWTAATDSSASWLSAGTTTGNLNAGGSQDVNIVVDSQGAGLKAGTYTGTITFTITTNGVSASIKANVSLAVQPAPCVQITGVNGSAPADPSNVSLTFDSVAKQSQAANQTVTITDCGDTGTWSVAVTSGAKWLSASASESSSGSISANTTQDISVWTDSLYTGLSVGTYTGTLTFSIQSSEGTQSVNASVTLVVHAPPCIDFSAVNGSAPSDPNSASLTFSAHSNYGGTAASQNVAVYNCGEAGTVSATITLDTGSGWLSEDLSNGTSLSAGGTQTVNIGAASTTDGTYTGHITFTITNSWGTSTVTVGITFTVSTLLT